MSSENAQARSDTLRMAAAVCRISVEAWPLLPRSSAPLTAAGRRLPRSTERSPSRARTVRSRSWRSSGGTGSARRSGRRSPRARRGGAPRRRRARRGGARPVRVRAGARARPRSRDPQTRSQSLPAGPRRPSGLAGGRHPFRECRLGCDPQGAGARSARTRPARATKFPRHIVVASDGSQKAQRAVDAAAELARAGRARVTLAFVDDGSQAGLLPPRVVEHAELLRERTGVTPDVAIVSGRAEPAIAAVATGLHADLIVVGSRGLRGVRALASISERVAHDAPVSVLIARTPELVLDPERTAAARGQSDRARERAFAERFAGPRVAIRAPVS